jgi:hypothetical protein
MIVTWVTSLFLISYLHWLIGLSIWVSTIVSAGIFGIFVIPSLGIYTVIILNLLYRPIFILIHLYTIAVAWQHAWWQGLITASLPGISQVYWCIIDVGKTGFRESLFCTILLWYALGVIMMCLAPVLIAQLARFTVSDNNDAA